jgi:stress-induced morphogen
MKRKDLLKYLDKSGCELIREGKKYTVYINRKKLKSTTIPRHREINDFLAKKICKDLEIHSPK